MGRASLDSVDVLVDLIGLRATLTLHAVYAGKKLYIPKRFKADCLLVALVGDVLALCLIDRFGGGFVEIPHIQHYKIWADVARVAVWRKKGKTVDYMAAALGCSRGRVSYLIRRAEAVGLCAPMG